MRSRSLLVLLLPLLASCSMALSKGPPAGWRTAGASDAGAFDSCSPTPIWGFVDTALSVVSLAAGYVASSGRLAPDEDRGEHILIGWIGGGLFGIGASVGFRRADACEDFRDGFPRSVLPDPDPTPGDASEAGPSDPLLITRADLAGATDPTVLAAVQRIRPLWLRRTGVRDEPPAVIMDNQTFGLDVLESILPDEVEWLRLVSPSDATMRWGTGYTGGAIEMGTRR